MSETLEFRLAGAGGEPVDLWRTLNSHGFVDLPPMRSDEASHSLEVTLPTGRGHPRTVRISEGRRGHGRAEVAGP